MSRHIRFHQRRDGRKRAVAVVVTALMMATLLTQTSTPASADPAPKREPDTAALAGNLTNQTINWGPCDFSRIAISTSEVRRRLLATPGLACADITVPLDWHNPQDGNTITLRISKTATSSGPNRQGIALVNPGGPGAQGLHWGAGMALRAPELAKEFNFIGFDPRGVGDSTPLTCRFTLRGEVEDLPTLDFDNAINRAFGEGCRTETPLAKFITTEQTTYDMDFIRVLLGEPRISYFGYSYGTWLGTWYAATFPSRVHRMVLDSATDVAESSLQRTWDLQARSRERAFQEQFLPYVARHNDWYGLGADPIAIRRAFEEAGGTRTLINKLLVSLIIIPAMYDTSQYYTAGFLVAPMIEMGSQGLSLSNSAADRQAAQDLTRAIIDRALAQPGLTADQRAQLNAAGGKALAKLAGLEPLNVSNSIEQFEAPLEMDPTTSVFETIRCNDGEWNQNLAYWDSWQHSLDRTAPFTAGLNISPFTPYNFIYPVCAFWETELRMPKPNSKTFPKVLVLNSELDAATAYEAAVDTAKHLPGARMISVDNEGSHGVFPYLTTCVDAPVIDYFLHGAMPTQQFTACQGLPLPGETETFNVAGTLANSGKIKLRMVTDEVREANQAFKHMLAATAEESGE